MKRIWLIQIAAFVVLAASVGAEGSGSLATGSYIVVLNDRVALMDTLNRHVSKFDVVPKHTYTAVFNGYSAVIPSAVVDELSRDPSVRFVSPDRPVSVALQEEPSGARRIDTVPGPSGGEGVSVAVLDTGIDLLHPDLQANIAGVFDCFSGADPIDLHGHGTHVAGTIAAIDNTIGVVGVAPKARIWAVRVLSDLGSGTYANVICGLEFVHARSPMTGILDPIRVANMSLGGYGEDDGNCGLTSGDAFHLAVCNVVGAGVTLVVAAGNDRTDFADFVPAAYDEAITVTALADSDGKPCGLGPSTSRGGDDRFASFSNYSGPTDVTHTVAAPGVDISSTYPRVFGGYTTMSGTSMASPHVAGAAAIYISQNPGATPAQVLAALKASGEGPNLNFKNECSAGSSSHFATSRHPEEVIRFAQ